MKLVFLFELAGLILFGSLFAPSLMYVVEGNPLPEIEKPENKSTIIEVATIDFEGTPVKLYYNSLQGFSYSDPNGVWERQVVPVCNADQSKCLYADFYGQFELKQNDVILAPDHIIEFSDKGIDTAIFIYILDTSSEILRKYTYAQQDIQRHCYNPDFCKTMTSLMPEDVRSLAVNWKEMTEFDRKKYVRYFDAILHVSNSWHVFHPETGGGSSSGSVLDIRWYQNEMGKTYISLSNERGGYNYYELTDAQFAELKTVIRK